MPDVLEHDSLFQTKPPIKFVTLPPYKSIDLHSIMY